MIASISFAQFIGDLVWVGFLVFVGAYLLWLWPAEVRRKLQAGKLSEAEAKEKLRKANPKFGYLAFLGALCQLALALIQWFSHT